MQQHIGGTKTTAWVEHMISFLSLSPQVKRAKELEEFTEKHCSLFDFGEPLDVATRRRLEAFFGHSLEEVRIHRGYQAEEASRELNARAFTFKGQIFGSRQNLDTSTVGGLGLLAHELTHVIQQTQPCRRPQGSLEAERNFPRQMANQDNSPVPVASAASHSDAEILAAPGKSSSLTTNPQLREAQAQSSERLVVETLSDNEPQSPPQKIPEEVANQVYRLMQYDLVLERERATKLGG